MVKNDLSLVDAKDLLSVVTKTVPSEKVIGLLSEVIPRPPPLRKHSR